ncbi:hypothetical protein VTN49DRAFT_1846 [Thermomyces lanuginosus]|uniref:uncharacterized protein n=1 Tax=Thermomyces lanuginosus TaxID=5541 RepID=UPI0037426F99
MSIGRTGFSRYSEGVFGRPKPRRQTHGKPERPSARETAKAPSYTTNPSILFINRMRPVDLKISFDPIEPRPSHRTPRAINGAEI